MRKALRARVHCSQVHDEQCAGEISDIALVSGGMCDEPRKQVILNVLQHADFEISGRAYLHTRPVFTDLL